jgi:hypothetical protein
VRFIARLCASLLSSACVDTERVQRQPVLSAERGDGTSSEDAGTEPAPMMVGKPAPLDTVFSVGINDNSGGAPQTASLLGLKFRGGVPGPSTVVAQRVSIPLTIDGTASDWIGIPESIVPLQTRGGAIGMTKEEWEREYTALTGRAPLYDFGVRSVSIRAAFDDERIYFVLMWADPTENRDRDTWVVDGGVFIRTRDNEDRAMLGFDIGKSTPGFQAAGCSAACHLRKRLGDTSDAGRAYRTRMHTDAPDEVLDVWTWRAATTDPMGAADDGYIDFQSRKFDGLSDWFVSNLTFRVDPDAGVIDGGVRDGGGIATPAMMGPGGINSNPVALYRPDAGDGRTPAIPFDPTGALPWARIPGVVMTRASPFRDDVRAQGRYAGGYWTVEFSRALVNPDPRDTQFPLR